MADCTHDLTERDVAVTANGMCPLCLVAEVDRLLGELKVMTDYVAAENRAERAEAELEEARRLLEPYAEGDEYIRNFLSQTDREGRCPRRMAGRGGRG